MKPRTVPVFTDRLEQLRGQVDAFREQVRDAQATYDALTAASPNPFRRSMTQTTAIVRAWDALQTATQGLRNAEHLYAVGLDIWDGEPAVPTVRVKVCPGCRHSLPEDYFTDSGVCDECGRSPPKHARRKPYVDL